MERLSRNAYAQGWRRYARLAVSRQIHAAKVAYSSVSVDDVPPVYVELSASACGRPIVRIGMRWLRCLLLLLSGLREVLRVVYENEGGIRGGAGE